MTMTGGALVRSSRLQQNTAQERLRACHAEGRGADLRGLDGVAATLVGDQVRLEHPERAELLDRLDLAPPRREAPVSEQAATAGPEIAEQDSHHAIALVEADVRVRPLPAQLERAGADPDAERHREAAHDRHARIPRQQSEAELEVEPGEGGEVPPPPATTPYRQHSGARLAYVAQVAEPLGGGGACLRRCHALRFVGADPLLEVERQLLIDLAPWITVREARCAPEIATAHQPLSSAATARLTAADSRVHPAACFSSSRSPAGVRE
jgi:hypothetical protein